MNQVYSKSEKTLRLNDDIIVVLYFSTTMNFEYEENGIGMKFINSCTEFSFMQFFTNNIKITSLYKFELDMINEFIEEAIKEITTNIMIKYALV